MSGYIRSMRLRFAALWLLVVGAWLGCTGTERIVFSEIAPSGSVAAPTTAGVGGDADAGSKGDAGLTGPAVERLRADASFDWPQTLPGAGTCEPGVYAGSFHCMLGFFALDGSIRFTLDNSNEAEVLEIVSGEFTGLDAGGFGELFSGGLTGRLECANQSLAARTVDGRALPMIPLLPIPAFDTFDATLDGAFNAAAQSINGTWHMVDGAGAVLCDGSFFVSRSP